ncbi:hypothetical protein EV646_110159 [Kribbella antiqua]|uniref:Uncharacterized protein n=1 Tax=Kribbella antiqua TaxID=2512217 RepID=A0A4R2IP02_9ACTN|nr:hypothetical protein [Kribbella antiqua]TCO44445.1 hypothetical protein EV646_110159 [Kribbella antiqua]
MSVLERVSAETRRSTGWLIPVAANLLVDDLAPGSGELVARTTQFWYGGLGLAGVLVGVLWQWFSPRELAERLLLAGGAFPVVCVLFLLPVDETHEDRYALYFCLGIVAGLVLATWWQRVRAAKSAGQSPGT